MPTISYFYGIAIQMFYDDHNPPHFHARYGRAKAMIRISDAEVIVGELPPTASKLVREWAVARRSDLLENWDRSQAHAPLERIPGPDGNA